MSMHKHIVKRGRHNLIGLFRRVSKHTHCHQRQHQIRNAFCIHLVNTFLSFFSISLEPHGDSPRTSYGSARRLAPPCGALGYGDSPLQVHGFPHSAERESCSFLRPKNIFCSFLSDRPPQNTIPDCITGRKPILERNLQMRISFQNHVPSITTQTHQEPTLSSFSLE